jgi:uncharacterized membrane protein
MMNMPWPKLWGNLHGGSTHLPIALAIASVLFDAAGYSIRREPYERDLHAAGFYALLLGVLGSFMAVLSGLVISSWEPIGKGTLALHHYFIWPAFGLFTAMAVWRVMTRGKASRRAMGAYLVVSLLTAGVMCAAGYWGGEMMG